MKKVLVGLVILLVLVLVIPWIVGMFVSRDHVASVRTVFAAEPDVVWEQVGNFETWPAWNSGVDSMERQADAGGHAQWLLSGPFGDMPIREIERGEHRLVTRIPEEAELGFHGTWTYVVEPIETGGSALVMTEDGTITNPIFRFMYVTVLDYHTTLRQFADDLGKHLGETVTPQVVE